MAELPGILNWALDGLDRLTQQGRFTQSEGGEEMKALQKAISSPEQVFIEEFCELGTGPEFWVLKEEFRHRWVTWRTASGVGGELGAVETVESISRKLFSAVPTVKGKRKMVNGKQQQCFLGIRFKADAPTQPPLPGS
jgi:putative DNA primase/helicase